jgi:hypothetical protein
MADQKKETEKSIKDFAWGMAAYSGASILGPIIIFGSSGYFLGQYLHATKISLLISIIVAFIFTNILILRKALSAMAELKNFKGSGKNGYDDDEES